MCNLHCHYFTIIIYNLDIPCFSTFHTLDFFLVLILKKYAVILADINLMIIHTELD
jgi:hypothetical protein